MPALEEKDEEIELVDYLSSVTGGGSKTRSSFIVCYKGDNRTPCFRRALLRRIRALT
jgi:hypothetical protein